MIATTSAPPAEDLLRRFAAALRSAQLYSTAHPVVDRNVSGLAAVIGVMHETQTSIVIGLVGSEIIVDNVPVASGDTLGGFTRCLKEIAIERITIGRGVTGAEISEFVRIVSASGSPAAAAEALPRCPHIRVGQVALEQRVEERPDMRALKVLYADAVAVADSLWESAKTEGHPDPAVARTMIENLAEAVSDNRTALTALATLKDYDDYTFTHMVNVSILTMAQARALGVDGALLREFGIAALMHDIGKVHTPLEILQKPDGLNEREFEVIARHPVDGAEMLRTTSDVPTLASIVAFEHHLRLDGSGYPAGVRRVSLNLATMLCSIADVYDAMRSRRSYQQAFPTDRILAILRQKDGRLFDEHLVRRFVQLVGIYPPGSLVRLDTGEVAAVVRIHAPNPHRPSVRILADANGTPIPTPYDVNLCWEREPDLGFASTVVAPLDARSMNLDPLAVL